MENIKNILIALEKASYKAQQAINGYNAIVSNPTRNFTPLKFGPYNKYFDKAVRIKKSADQQHEEILTNLWNQGIFL